MLFSEMGVSRWARCKLRRLSSTLAALFNEALLLRVTFDEEPPRRCCSPVANLLLSRAQLLVERAPQTGRAHLVRQARLIISMAVCRDPTGRRGHMV